MTGSFRGALFATKIWYCQIQLFVWSNVSASLNDGYITLCSFHSKLEPLGLPPCSLFWSTSLAQCPRFSECWKNLHVNNCWWHVAYRYWWYEGSNRGNVQWDPSWSHILPTQSMWMLPWQCHYSKLFPWWHIQSIKQSVWVCKQVNALEFQHDQWGES